MPRRRRVPGTLERRGHTYRVRIRMAGERFAYTVRTTDRRIAQQFAIAKAHELARDVARRSSGLLTGVRVSALLAQFERNELPALTPGTQGAYGDSLKPIREYFTAVIGDPTVEAVQARHIMEYLAWRRTHRLDGRATLSNRTLQKDRAVLHRLFTIADRLEYRDGNPVARTPMPKADRRDPIILTDDQYDKLLTECAGRPMLALYVLVLGETGLRCESEALHLTWDDVRLDDGFLWVASGRDGHRTKAGKGRWVPMTPRLMTAMREHFARYRFAQYGGRATPWVFHHDHRARRFTSGERVQCLRAAFQSAAKRAKLPEALRQHDLRHRRVTTWLADGKAATLVREAMGHSDLRTTMGYTHLAREHLRGLVDGGTSATPRAAERQA